jgi:hypothetical protein
MLDSINRVQGDQFYVNFLFVFHWISTIKGKKKSFCTIIYKILSMVSKGHDMEDQEKIDNSQNVLSEIY